MTPDRWRRIEELYHAALARVESERPAFLTEACAGDDALRREVESLLAQPASADGFLDTAARQQALKAFKAPPYDASETSRTTENPLAQLQPETRDTHNPAPRHPFVWVVWLTALVTIGVFSYAAWLVMRNGGGEDFGWTEAQRSGAWYVTSVSPEGPARGRL